MDNLPGIREAKMFVDLQDVYTDGLKGANGEMRIVVKLSTVVFSG